MQGELLAVGQGSVSLRPNLQHKRTHYCSSGKEKDKLASDQDLLQAAEELVQQHWL